MRDCGQAGGAGGLEARLAGKRVLVLEDEALVAMLAEDLLEELGAEVLGPARDLEEAEQLVAGAAPHAALLDLNIAGASSLALGAALSARGVAVVFATGYQRPCLPALPNATWLEKPYGLAHLRTALLTALCV